MSVTAFVECANRQIHIPNTSTLHSTISCRVIHVHLNFIPKCRLTSITGMSRILQASANLFQKQIYTCNQSFCASAFITACSIAWQGSLCSRSTISHLSLSVLTSMFCCLYTFSGLGSCENVIHVGCGCLVRNLDFGLWKKNDHWLWKGSKCSSSHNWAHGVPFLPFSVKTGLGLPKMVLPLTPLFGNTCNFMRFPCPCIWMQRIEMT